MQVRRSFAEELDLSASEVEIVLDYFVYGREVFQPEEVAFVEGMYMASKQISHFNFGSRDSRKFGSPEFLDSAKLTAMLENLLADVSNFVNSKNGAPMQFDNGLPLVDGKYVKFPIRSTKTSLLRGGCVSI